MRHLKYLLVCLALCFSIHSVYSQEQEHEQRTVLHPCGETGLDFKGLTSFFQYRWHAEYRDLSDTAVKKWLRHHKLENTDITIVRIFQSRMQTGAAVLHGRRFVNYLEPGVPLVDMFCIVKINGSLVLTYKMDEILTILNSGETDI